MKEYFITVAVSAEIKPDFVSRMIMWFTKATFSHIMIIDKGEIVHSVGEGNSKADLNKYLETHKLQAKRIRLKKPYDYFRGYVDGSQGKEYSESQYWGFLFKPLRKFFRNGNEKEICSEYVARCLNHCCGYDFKDMDFLTPKQVWEDIEDESHLLNGSHKFKEGE